MTFQLPLPARLQVTALIRALDTGKDVVRFWRMTRAIGPAGVRLAEDLPLEPGRPVEVSLRLPGAMPDEPAIIVVTGHIAEIAASAHDEPASANEDPDRPRRRAIAFIMTPDDAGLARVSRYVEERMLLS